MQEPPPFRRLPRCGFSGRKLDGFVQIFAVQHADKHDQQYRRHCAERQHMQHKLPDTRAELREQKQILRAAEGHQQGTADCRDILHGDHRQDVLLLFPGTENQDCQRHKDHERDVIRHEHG